MSDVLCLVLGGGRGTRLYPLTKDRSKPAVPFAGKYRLIDIPISNSLNSGLNNIYVLTQFNSESLNKHINRTYKMDPFTRGYVEIMAAEQSMESSDWFQGTADAVRRCMKHFNEPEIKYVLILSGDQLYKMDLRRLIAFHIEKQSQITIACHPVGREMISEYGIMGIDKKGRINSFVEKPQAEKIVESLKVDVNNKPSYLASMGIYLFNKEVLKEILIKNSKADFGRGVIPDSFAIKPSYAYIHTGYWEDIGTIKAFYRENLVLTEAIPPIDFFDENWQFFTRPRYLPPAKIETSEINHVIIGEGCILNKCKINKAIIGLRSRIEESSQIEESIIMGADYYQSIDEIENDKRNNIPPVGIGKNCIVRKAIVDKNARIGDNTQITNRDNLNYFDSTSYFIRDGIVIIPKNTTIPAGTVI